MKFVARLLFWVSVFGTALAQLAPLLFGGASYKEAQPGVIFGLVLTFLFMSLGLPSAQPRPGSDPFAQRMVRRGIGVVHGLVAFLVIGVASAIEFSVSYDELENLRSSSSSMLKYRLDDVAAGSWTGVIGLVAAGVAFLVMVSFAASKPKRPVVSHPYPPYGWYPQQHQHVGYGHGPGSTPL
jgi:hypothetical protein